MIDLVAPLLAGFEGNLRTLPEQLVLGLLTGAIYALIALGYTMVYGILKLINFAHGEIFMLGAYVGLFISWMAIGDATTRLATAIIEPSILGSLATVMMAAGLLVMLSAAVYSKSKGKKATTGLFIGTGCLSLGVLSYVLATYQPQAITMVVMLLASMVGCSIVGVLIEFFAYRPMRSQPRIAALITAIGVSLLIQFTGQLFLPNAPPPSVSEQVNPYTGSISFYLKPPPAQVVSLHQQAEQESKVSTEAFNKAAVKYSWDTFNLPAEAQTLREAMQTSERKVRDLQGEMQDKSVGINIPTGQAIMFVTAIVLMVFLRHLVMKTATGRAMRAVSHDFDAASLMGVNVNKIITITFIIGSSLAGAGAMMNATVLGTPLSSFYGVQPGVKAFVAAVLGGIGNIPGAVLGGLLMGLAEGLVVWAGYSSLKDAIAFVILIAILLFRPGGLLGSSAVEKV